MTSYFDASTPDEFEPTADAEFVADDSVDVDAFDQVDDSEVEADLAGVDLDVEIVDEVELTDLDRLDQPVSATVAQGSLFSSSTGDPRVDGAVSRLADLATSDITEHPAVLEDVHRRLYDALADLDK